MRAANYVNLCWEKCKIVLFFNPVRNPLIPTSTQVYPQIFFNFLYLSKFYVALCSIKTLFSANQRKKLI